MLLIKVPWYVLKVKNMYSDDPQTPWVHEVRQSQATRTYIKTHFSVSSPHQCQSQAVLNIGTPKMYPWNVSLLVLA